MTTIQIQLEIAKVMRMARAARKWSYARPGRRPLPVVANPKWVKMDTPPEHPSCK